MLTQYFDIYDVLINTENAGLNALDNVLKIFPYLINCYFVFDNFILT